MQAVSAAERPDLVEVASRATNDVLPEYNQHGDTLTEYWPRLSDEFAEYQFFLIGDEDRVHARGHSVPLRWNGAPDDLPPGIDGAIVRGFQKGAANALCALLVAVPHSLQGRRISTAAIHAMRDIARVRGMANLIAPVRPSWKERYPLIAIEDYANWRRPDGSLFDPWMRVHERLGATIIKPEPRSLRITGTVGEWEAWTRMAFPQSGEYWFPGGLATVAVDRDRDTANYWEPNVWMHHTLAAPGRTE
jgi:hypothetical protein